MSTILRRLTNINMAVFLILIVVAVGSSIFSALYSPAGADSEWWSGWLQNFSTEMMGAIVTFALFELLIGGRKAALDEQRRVAELRTRLLRDARSIVNDIAIKAVEEIYAYDWLEGDDGMLKGGNLMIANLQGVNLAGANLQGANLVAANLQHANLMLANLKGADLVDANLQGANLRLADLSGAKLGLAKFTEETVLPDNTKWSPEVDTGRFTDSSHPQFWQPSRAKEKSDNKDGGTVQ